MSWTCSWRCCVFERSREGRWIEANIRTDSFNRVKEGSDKRKTGLFGSQLERHKLINQDYQSVVIFLLMNNTGDSFGSNPASLKGKLQTLEVPICSLSNKSKTSRLNSTITRNKCRFWEARKTLWSRFWPWKLQTSRRAFRTSLCASKKKCN